MRNEHVAVRIVESLLQRAIKKGASDIHLEPFERELRIRFRRDGVLHACESVDVAHTKQVISRFKVLAHINTSENRVPQDGTFRFAYKKGHVDVRVSTFPSLYGQKIVARILNRENQAIDVDHLGLSINDKRVFNAIINRTHGLFLVTGPTGSGKTTTLYAALSQLHTVDKNIVTLEDPVEYALDGITQGNINNAKGFTFAVGIRAVLRQDPDILLVGEIRDKLTAHTAIEAALTGHLVLSTLHTNDAPSALVRLLDMGIDSFLINAVVAGVLAQRLVRLLCSNCKQKRACTQQECDLFSKYNISCTYVYDPYGCASCEHTGYAGRIGVFELLPMTDSLRSLVTQRVDIQQIRDQAVRDGMCEMFIDGLKKVAQGIVSLQELLAVVSL